MSQPMNQPEMATFLHLVQSMRQAQIKYFSSRTDSNLREAKRLESRVDELLKSMNLPSKPTSEQINFF